VSAALRVQIADKSGLCKIAEPSSRTLAGSRSIRITIGIPGAAVPAAKYDLPPSGPANVSVELETSDPQCLTANSASATTGTLTLDAVTSSEVSGSFDVVFPGATAAGNHVSGKFVAPLCEGSAPVDGGPATCA
jgi:hypothetical protein